MKIPFKFEVFGELGVNTSDKLENADWFPYPTLSPDKEILWTESCKATYSTKQQCPIPHSRCHTIFLYQTAMSHSSQQMPQYPSLPNSNVPFLTADATISFSTKQQCPIPHSRCHNILLYQTAMSHSSQQMPHYPSLPNSNVQFLTADATISFSTKQQCPVPHSRCHNILPYQTAMSSSSQQMPQYPSLPNSNVQFLTADATLISFSTKQQCPVPHSRCHTDILLCWIPMSRSSQQTSYWYPTQPNSNVQFLTADATISSTKQHVQFLTADATLISFSTKQQCPVPHSRCHNILLY